MYEGLVTHDINAIVRRSTSLALDAMPVMCSVAEKWLRTTTCQVHLAVRPMQAGRGDEVPLDNGSSEHLLGEPQGELQRPCPGCQRSREVTPEPAPGQSSADRLPPAPMPAHSPA